MAAITASMVKELREMTDAGMMECKKALVEADGDMEKAVDVLRTRGLAAAAKKAGRATNEGTVMTVLADDAKSAAVVELNCETDFVGMNEKFKAYAEKLGRAALAANAADVEALRASTFEGEPVEDILTDAIHVLGENIQLPRATTVNAGGIASYIHGGGKIGVLVETKNDNPATFSAPAFKAFYHDVALQIAAARPSYVRKDEVPSENLNKEKEILRAQALNEGKPEKIVDKMVEGRIEKYYKEVCLLEQPFVKDGDKSIQKLTDEVAKEIGAAITVVSFERFERGEGIEKRQDNFAEEIAAQMQKK